MEENGSPHSPVISFGAFRFFPVERRLEENGLPVHVGGRSLSILDVLLSRPNEIVSNRELIARVWSDVTVDDGSLRVHLANLRKVLADNRSDGRCIRNIPGRGYCFVAPVVRSVGPFAAGGILERQNLPIRATRIIGREEDIGALTSRLLARRFVTIVGAGGIGKTTVAVAVGEALVAEFGAVRFIDLGSLRDPTLVAATVASGLGIVVRSHDPVPDVVSFLRDKRILVILDCCEHLIGSSAALAERIFRETTQTHILVTSREPLLATGENVYGLPPLANPPGDGFLDAKTVMSFSAVQLFVERTNAGRGFLLKDSDARTVARICSKLDGIPLAIELAAGRLEAYGLEGLVALLGHRLDVLSSDGGTTLPRHQTLRATLDWSYDLLCDAERKVLRRLSVFVGSFTLEAATALALADQMDRAAAIDAVANLVSKSLIMADITGALTRYRLLDSTRAYVHAKLVEKGEDESCARLQAEFYCGALRKLESYVSGAGATEGKPDFRQDLPNIRSALEWAFKGAPEIGVSLVAASARLFLELSLLAECHVWTEAAIAHLGTNACDPRTEMEIQAALSVSIRYTRGNTEEAYAALTRSLALAEAVGAEHYQIRMLEGLYIFHLRKAEFKEALTFAKRRESIAASLHDAEREPNAEWMSGVLDHFMGEHSRSHRRCENTLRQFPKTRKMDVLRFGIDQRMLALSAVARGLWFRGYPDQALATMNETIAEIEALDHPVSYCTALAWVMPVALWSGEWKIAESGLTTLIEQSESNQLLPYQALGLGLRGELFARRGRVEIGVEHLREGLQKLSGLRHMTMNTALMINLAEALSISGRGAEGMTTIDAAIARIENIQELTHLPEAARVRATAMRCLTSIDSPDVEQQLLVAIDLARKQSTLSWELRAAMDLANIWRDSRRRDAHVLLQSLYDKFSEGFETYDLRTARRLLEELS
jgi:predicted ATPase/DNA-binding winged helix-turn-helix (wHTH) protein